jgi:tetratricopeptide (TPR) repeat protein
LTIFAAGVLLGSEGKASGNPLQIIVVKTHAEADQILERLKKGQFFSYLAKQYSLDPSSEEGGYVGISWFSNSPAGLEGAVQNLKPGQVGGIIEAPQGFLIVKGLSEREVVWFEHLRLPNERIPPARREYEPVTLVCGGLEADTFFAGLSKPSGYERNLQTNCDCWMRAINGGRRQAEGFLSDLVNQTPVDSDTRNKQMRGHYLLGQVLCYSEKFVEATQHFESAYEISGALGDKDYQHRMAKILGIAYLKLGEVGNWIRNRNPQSSIFPIPPEGQFQHTQPSDKAREYFLTYLKEAPDDLEEKWLLNLTCMTLGRYPDGVPPEYQISLAPFESKDEIGRFLDVSAACGLNVFASAGGVIMDDFDNDGYLDLVLSDMDPCASLRYFHNNGDGSFADWSAQAGFSNQLSGLNIVQGDFNNDGWLDIYIPRGSWRTPLRHSLLRNNGDGTFTDVTAQAGLGAMVTASQVAAWADFDNDGLLDLFVGNENAPSQLFHNNGDGTFTEVGHIAGVDRIAFTKGATWGDYDNNGIPDLYISNFSSENFLYHNNGDGTFTEVARDLHVEKPIWSFPVWFFDYDNDGWLDLYVSGFTVSVTEVITSYLNPPGRMETQKLYKNVKGMRFDDVTKEVGLDRVVMAMGANFGDVNNDGFLDIYLGTGSPSYASLVPNILYLNRGGKYFADITASSGTGSLQKGHGTAIGDIFNTGQPAIVVEQGGMGGGDRYYTALFRNPGTGNNWISIKLVGVKTNRSALGARIKLTLEGPGHATRSIYRDVNSGGSFGSSPLCQHLGLGKATRIDTLEVWWPTSKTRQVFHNVNSNQYIEIHEFAREYLKLNRQPVPVLP